MFPRWPVLLWAAVIILGGCASWPKEEPSPAPAEEKTAELVRQKAAYEKELAEREFQIGRLKEQMAAQQAAVAKAQQEMTSLARSVEELSAQVKRLEEAGQRQQPLREAEIRPPAKGAERRREPAKKEALAEELGRIKKELRSRQTNRLPATEEAKKSVTKSPPVQPGQAASGREPALPEDLSAQLKLLEEAAQKGEPKARTGEKEAAGKESGPETPAGAGKAVKSPPAGQAKAAPARSLKVKVLSGDGRKESARAMAARLRKMGYRVDLTDRAERSDFEGITVYYASGHRQSADALAKRLGPEAKTKPLSWSSSFDLIVVTGLPAR